MQYPDPRFCALLHPGDLCSTAWGPQLDRISRFLPSSKTSSAVLSCFGQGLLICRHPPASSPLVNQFSSSLGPPISWPFITHTVYYPPFIYIFNTHTLTYTRAPVWGLSRLLSWSSSSPPHTPWLALLNQSQKAFSMQNYPLFRNDNNIYCALNIGQYSILSTLCGLSCLTLSVTHRVSTIITPILYIK